MPQKKGLSRLECVIAIIILAILATIGYLWFSSAMERSVKARAKTLLDTLRKLEIAYMNETGRYSNLAGLSTHLPEGKCAATHYFAYTCNAATGSCTADRCNSGGKTPDVAVGYDYTITLDINGNFSGTGDWR